MKTIQEFNVMIVLYVAVLFFLLLSVLAVPLSIQRDWLITQEFIIEEEFIETALMAVLFGISFFILKRFKHKLNNYEKKFSRADKKESKLLSRLNDAFRYIGTVNVELQEIHSILQKLDNYPRTKKEIRQLVDYLATKAMVIAKSPWIAIRMIDKKSGRTVYDSTVVRPGHEFQTGMIGNREILENNTVPGIIKIINRKKNVDLITVCVLPEVECSEEETILIKLIIDQIEMYFLLYHKDFFPSFSKGSKKEELRIFKN
jgi:uncharacterized membrane protein YciS (DUF1049 family)